MPEYLFCNVGWMKYYKGQQDGDEVIGGGDNPEKHESCNYVNVDGQHYGYVQVKGDQLNLARLGVSDPGAKFVDNVTVIWTAKRPQGGVRVVGWYKNARVYRTWQNLNERQSRVHKHDGIYGYRISAPADQATLIHHLRRNTFVPVRSGQHPEGNRPEWGLGNSLVYYARDKNGDLNPAFFKEAADILSLIKHYGHDVGSTVDEDIDDILHDPTIDDTERETLVSARRGQGSFRSGVMKLAGGVCCLTGVGNDVVLRAGHIKPWAQSDNRERLDRHNGLLLTPTADHLFDRGLISFSEIGELLISSSLSEEDEGLLGANKWNRRIPLSPRQLAYMKHHRDFTFRAPARRHGSGVVLSSSKREIGK